MTDNYSRLVAENLQRLYSGPVERLASELPAEQEGSAFTFRAFGRTCTLGPEGIESEKGDLPPVMGVITSLYALHAKPDPLTLTPFKAYKDFPGTMPYVGAFATHTEQILVPQVGSIEQNLAEIRDQLDGSDAPPDVGGDFSFMVRPLPKIALCYIFYEADEDFPASVTCLYSNNANAFLPLDALADVGEYTSKAIIEMLGGSGE